MTSMFQLEGHGALTSSLGQGVMVVSLCTPGPVCAEWTLLSCFAA